MSVCHSCNNRHQSQIVRKYADNIRKMGNHQDARGKAIACGPLTPDGPFRLVGYGTLCRAIYLAAKLWPNEPNVVQTVEQGLTIDVYDPLMAEDVCVFMRDWLNRFHTGSDISFNELLLKAPEVEARLNIFLNSK
eukprot:4786002-Alexandrium_andersonii.AAC.1